VEWGRTHPRSHCVDLLLEIQPCPVLRSVRSFGYQQVRVGSVGTIFGLTHRAFWTHHGGFVECGLRRKRCKEVDVWLSGLESSDLRVFYVTDLDCFGRVEVTRRVFVHKQWHCQQRKKELCPKGYTSLVNKRGIALPLSRFNKG
jgi:hypothetical protein